MTTTTYAVTCLSPVHIGTGTQFGKCDGLYHDRRWHLIDLDKMLRHGGDTRALATAMSDRNFTWAAWLRNRGMAPAEVTAYVLPCPQDPEDTPVREALKDVHRRPYLPGTSVKGAIRTAVMWQLLNSHAPYRTFAAQYLTLCLRARDLFQQIEQRHAFDKANVHREVLAQTCDLSDDEARSLQQTLYRILNVREERLAEQRRSFQQRLERLGRSREWLGQHVEREVFGRDPNHDLMRAVQVSDSAPVGIGRLAVGLVWTYTLRSGRLVEKREQDGEYKTFVEWLTADTTLQLTIRIDDFLFTRTADRDLHFCGMKEQAVRQLARVCNEYARTVIAAEKEFYEKYDLSVLGDFYVGLERTLGGLPDGAFLLDIGWGGGWEVKTVGDLIHMMLGEEDCKRLRQQYRLGENPKTRQIHWDAPFPHTRRIAYEGGAPVGPLGWIQLIPKEP